MNVLDILILIPIAFGIWRGFKKGFIIELFTFLALFIGLYAGIHFSDGVASFLQEKFSITSEYLPTIAFTITFLLIGAMVYFAGVAIVWRSKAQKNVTLSSSEAEYVALSDCVKDVRFVMQILTELEVQYPKPVVVKIENVGAMFMAENISSSARTRHINVRLKFVNEFIEQGEIEVVFVKSADNNADVFTKNTSGEIHEKLTAKFQSK